MDRPEPNAGEKIILCAHLPPDDTIDTKDRDDVMLRYEPTGAKSLTSSGIYLKANWMGCCRVCYREGRSNTDEIKFTKEGVWRGFQDKSKKREEEPPLGLMKADMPDPNLNPPSRAASGSDFSAQVVRGSKWSGTPTEVHDQPPMTVIPGTEYGSTQEPPKAIDETGKEPPVELKDKPDRSPIPVDDKGNAGRAEDLRFPQADDVTSQERIEEQDRVMREGGGPLPPEGQKLEEGGTDLAVIDNEPTDAEEVEGTGVEEDNPKAPDMLHHEKHSHKKDKKDKKGHK